MTRSSDGEVMAEMRGVMRSCAVVIPPEARLVAASRAIQPGRHRVDCGNMRPGMAFADVLSETLASYSTTEGVALPPPAPATYPRPVGFFAAAPANVVAFSGGSFKGTATRQAVASAYGVAAAQTAGHDSAHATVHATTHVASLDAATLAAGSGAVGVGAPSTATPVIAPGAPSRFSPSQPARVVAHRTLSPRQRRALDRLVEMGAEIGTDFTPEQLRSAYRRLARRYHPDHHPETTEAQRQQLARLFTQARDSYSELQAA
jgi:hypothetical protein